MIPLLLGVGWVVVVVAIAVLTALLVGGIVAALGDAAPAVAVIVVLLVILAAVVGAAFFAVRLTLSAPALMLERTGVLESLRRSWSLTRGHFWRIFGSLALAVVIVSVISYALMIPLSLGMAFTGTDMTAMVVTMIVSIGPGRHGRRRTAHDLDVELDRSLPGGANAPAPLRRARSSRPPRYRRAAGGDGSGRVAGRRSTCGRIAGRASTCSGVGEIPSRR
ncbi:glycerophosphoryl diester phosphodiesterase membrane domain-containing protein [Georgenia sp. SUBG003]|uniref:glycerophosphoryl diester phosphodiesterase membrane domain-containing protein n=1 Tax=Georgenia sp. SUBG003 TaxID=1497974 RepID=UPI003AB6900A